MALLDTAVHKMPGMTPSIMPVRRENPIRAITSALPDYPSLSARQASDTTQRTSRRSCRCGQTLGTRSKHAKRRREKIIDRETQL